MYEHLHSSGRTANLRPLVEHAHIKKTPPHTSQDTLTHRQTQVIHTQTHAGKGSPTKKAPQHILPANKQKRLNKKYLY